MKDKNKTQKTTKNFLNNNNSLKNNISNNKKLVEIPALTNIYSK